MAAFPTDDLTTTHLDATGDDPSQARAELESCVNKVKAIIAAYATASGFASLDASSLVPSAQLGKAVLIAGSTMTGKLTLDGDPTANLHAATKQYVDAAVAASTPFAAGTKMLFRNLTVTGWTMDASFNEHAIRIVTGGPLSTGGTANLTTVFGSGKSTASHTLTEAEMPAHTHPTDSQGAHTHTITHSHAGGSASHTIRNDFIGDGGSNTDFSTDSSGAHAHTAQATGGGGGHSHGLSLDLKFVDFAVFVKN